MAVTGQESTDDLKLKLARRLYTAVVINSSSLKLKEALKLREIEKIVNLLKKRSYWNGLRTFLQWYPCFFLVVEESGNQIIKPIVTIEFCRDFDGKKGCGKNFCSKLHVCRHFVKGKCTFGPRCKKPHHFQSTETQEILKKHFLDALTDEQTREFLCRNVQHLLEPDRVNTDLPKSLEICKYYNVATGCTREFCPFIHICRFYAEEGNCKFGSQCIRKHDINNVHSRILLHRYHMDTLNEHQIMTYLKIKGETREQQTTTKGDSSRSSPPLLSPSNTPLKFPTNYTPPFSLQNTILGTIQVLVNEGTSRKLSQPNPPLTGYPKLEDLVQTRKLSLPNPPIHKPTIFSHPVTHEENGSTVIHIQSTTPAVSQYLSQSASETSIGTRHLNNKYTTEFPVHSRHELFRKISNGGEFINNSFNSKNSSLSNSLDPKDRQISISQSYNESLVTKMSNSFQHNFLLNNNSDSKYPLNLFEEGLGLNHLSPPTTTTTTDMTTTTLGNYFHSNIINHKHPSRSRSYENFKSHDIDRNNILNNGISKLPYTHSMHSDTSSFFTSRAPFMRASSSDISSPTGSSSSINNGHLSFFDSSEWSDNERILRNYISKEDDELNLPYYRTRSLPNVNPIKNSFDNFRTDNILYTQETLKPKNTSDCVCQKNQICSYFLEKQCDFRSCKKIHSDVTFQWQIYSVAMNNTLNGHKNENFDKQTKRRWINIDKNENLKLELAFCSVEIEQAEIDFYGDNITVHFDEMIGLASTLSTNHVITSRSCDLSSWLLQSTDETNKRQSQDYVIYKTRRVSTPSSVNEDVDQRFATLWLWYWQDSFGMWRNYPINKSDVIEANSACLVDEIEAKYLEGHEQYLFEEQNIMFDFKAMTQIQINCGSRKQKKIRRRPKFVSAEERLQLKSMEPFTQDIKRPWYWNSETNDTFDLVTVKENTEILSTVKNHFTQSMSARDYQILSIKSNQNLELWSKFIKLRLQMSKSDVKAAEKFVFKSVEEGDVHGILKQGFYVCTCNHANRSKYNYFDLQANTTIDDSYNYITGGIRYMFCVRMSIPLTDLNENLLIKGTDENVSTNDTNEQNSVVCRHPYQVYPEFLIIFKI